jgi:hypothetical protein
MLDANILFAGIVWPRWSHEVLQHAQRGDYTLVLAPVIIAQAKRTFHSKYPSLLQPFEAWLERCPIELVADASEAQVVAQVDLVRQIEDVPVALAAIHASVDYFVSEDKDFTERSPSTETIHRQLTIMRPVIFLREVMGWSRADLERVRYRNWPPE